jgi:restriction endonuclease S subunit
MIRKVLFSEIAKIGAGQGAPQESSAFTSRGKPFIRAGSLNSLCDGESYNSLERINDESAKKYRMKLYGAGTVVFAKSGMSATLDRVYVLPESAYVVGHLSTIELDLDVADPMFIRFFWEKYKPSRLIKDDSYPSISAEDIAQVRISLPPLPEQHRVADLLSRADRLRRLCRVGDSLSAYLLQSVFLEMFGDPAINPKGCDFVELNQLIREKDKINYGVVQPGDDFPDGAPIVRVGDFDLLGVTIDHLKRINPDVEKQYKRSRLIGNEILIACVGSIGKIALADERLKGFNIVRAVARVPLSDKINRSFAAIYLTLPYVQKYFANETRTVAQPTLNIEQIEETPILLPPLSQQEQFAAVVHQVESLQVLAGESARQSNMLFQNLLSLAFQTHV